MANQVKENKLQFEMDSGWDNIKNHFRRGRGHMFAYLWNRFQWDYFYRLGIVTNFPLNVDIESSSRCNIKCEHCFRQYMDMHESDFMPMPLYKKIVDECARYNLFTLKFSMRGEPTLNPKIVEMVAYAKQKGIKEVWINTNGSLLTENMAEGLISAGLDCLTVSFDGLGKMYERIRTPLKYEDTLSKIKMFADVRKKLNAVKPIFKVQSIWSAIKDNPEEYLQVVGSIVDKVSYNINFDYENIHFVPDPNYVCYRLWQRIAITSTGDVLKCPSDFKKEEVLGNVQDLSIKEIWDSKQEEERKRHLGGKRLESLVCKECHHGATVIRDEKAYSGRKHEVNEVLYEEPTILSR